MTVLGQQVRLSWGSGPTKTTMGLVGVGRLVPDDLQGKYLLLL